MAYKTIPITILLIAALANNAFPQNGVVADKYDRIVAAADALGVGFPFNSRNRLTDRTTFQIGQKIYELHRDGVLENGQRAKVLREIIKSNWNEMSELGHNGYESVGTLIQKERQIDVALLFAAFAIAAKTREIAYIEPFLDLSKVYIGSEAAAFDSPGAVTSLASAYSSYLANKDLTKQQRMAFWPAANAVLSNPTTTVPLLAKAVKKRDLPELLRLRAAAYLREMAPELLSGELMKKTEPAFAKKIQCIIDKKSAWDSVGVNVCAPFDENIAKQFKAKMDRMDALRERRWIDRR